MQTQIRIYTKRWFAAFINNKKKNKIRLCIALSNQCCSVESTEHKLCLLDNIESREYTLDNLVDPRPLF